MRHIRALLFLLSSWLPLFAGPPLPSGYGTYLATAYSQSGKTASGVITQRHVVAADPDLIPIGSRIKIKGAGRYSGEYVVADTGRKIQGRRLDIFMPSERSCVRFGRKRVSVKVIQVGNGTKQGTVVATQEVKKDVQAELTKKAVGSAATDEDYALKKKGVDVMPGTPVASPAPENVSSPK